MAVGRTKLASGIRRGLLSGVLLKSKEEDASALQERGGHAQWLGEGASLEFRSPAWLRVRVGGSNPS